MTAFGEASEAALDVARARHEAILGGDFERYAALSDELSASCEVLEQAAGDGEDRSVFDELAALESASLRVLEAQAGEVSERLGELASQARSHRAYGASERFSVNRL